MIGSVRKVSWGSVDSINVPSNDNGFHLRLIERNNVKRTLHQTFPHARGKRSLSTRQAGIEMRAAKRAHLARGLPLTSLPFSGSNVPEAIELLNASGAVTQTLMLSTNQVGSVQLVTDATTGEVVQRIEYDEFGRVLADSAPGLQPFGFAGGLYDAETQLVRFGARDYSAEVGRWVARDPVKRAGGSENYFSYVDNEPVSRADFGGLAVYKCVRWGTGQTSIIRHAYTCVKTGSHTKCFGNGGDSKNDVYDPKKCTKIDEDSQCMDRCVEDEIDHGDKKYNPFTNNCHHWQERMLSKCKKRCGDY